jgi:hypothetical protein
MDKDPIMKAARWLERSEEAERMANGFALGGAREQMLKIAETYRHLAESAVEWGTRAQADREGHGSAQASQEN